MRNSEFIQLMQSTKIYYSGLKFFTMQILLYSISATNLATYNFNHRFRYFFFINFQLFSFDQYVAIFLLLTQ